MCVHSWKQSSVLLKFHHKEPMSLMSKHDFGRLHENAFAFIYLSKAHIYNQSYFQLLYLKNNVLSNDPI